MLNNNNHNSSCEFSAEIISYLYNESSEVTRGKFESHLAACDVCTDEFAAISNARFSVFEWQKEEFAHLPTPEIVIPYTAKQPGAERVATAGFLAGLRELLSFLSSPSTVTVAAALAVCLGIGFLAMNYVGLGELPIVANNNVNDRSLPPVDSKIALVNTGLPDISPGNNNAPDGDVTTASKNSTTGHDVRAVKAVVDNRRSRPDRRLTAEKQKSVNNVAGRNPTRQIRKAPVLSGFEDDDDNSLRLSDLFDEIGSKL